ncbi:mannitol-1-phosphate 5-dehydrogenase [Bengtsoniella intestinalis]|uniref:mannitol-1-phosphate 5-dehydrogenase n=1 Tax=Bengtsoniella intestinalis TaxID=3073143 RepID=UPI00391F5677
MKQAVMFGAGNIGRGFIGGLLAQSGYEIVFADVNQAMLDALNETKGYTIFVCDTVCSEQTVEHVSALHSADSALVDAIADAELVGTAVGLGILPRVAPTIAKAIAKRQELAMTSNLNVIACENAIRASSQLKASVYEHLSADQKAYADQYIGFPDCAVDRIVPPVTNERMVDVSVEAFYEWSVEQSAFAGEVPTVEGMHLVDDLMAYIERKLFTLNTGHAVTAYLGSIKGYETLQESFKDPAINAFVRDTMAESGAGLVQKHGFDPAAHAAYIEKIAARFQNDYLVDVVDRVGRSPKRKLASTDRLVSPLMTAKGFGLPYQHLVVGIGAALCYTNGEDPESVEVQETLATQGFMAGVSTLTGIEDAGLLNEIYSAYLALKTLS